MYVTIPVDNFGTVVGENPTSCEILALWDVNGLSIVYWVACPEGFKMETGKLFLKVAETGKLF